MMYDEHLTPNEIRLIETLKGQSRMEQDQIIYEYERGNNYDVIRNERTS
jgi:hypothetical protein